MTLWVADTGEIPDFSVYYLSRFPELLWSVLQDLFSVQPQEAQGVADPPTDTLSAELTQEGDGTWTISLTEAQGTEVFRKGGYKNPKSAKGGAYFWVQKHYAPAAQEQGPDARPPKRAAPFTNRPPSPAYLSKLLELRARSNEEKASQLRAEADRLDREAQSLREATNIIGGAG